MILRKRLGSLWFYRKINKNEYVSEDFDQKCDQKIPVSSWGKNNQTNQPKNLYPTTLKTVAKENLKKFNKGPVFGVSC